MMLSSLGFGDYPNQYFLISYPKSGNTWVRFLLANLLKSEGEKISLQNVGVYVPDLYIKNQRQNVVEQQSIFNNLPIRIVKTHDPYFPYYRNKKIIYLVRDGRDVLNSYYYYLNSRQKTPISILNLITWNEKVPMGKWSNHVLGWKNAICQGKIIIRYEDLIRDTYRELLNLLRFLDWDIDSSKIMDAIQESSFEKLQQVERKFGGVNDTRTKAGRATPFFRKGKVNDWQNTFSASDIKEFWRQHKKGMNAYNYS